MTCYTLFSCAIFLQTSICSYNGNTNTSSGKQALLCKFLCSKLHYSSHTQILEKGKMGKKKKKVFSLTCIQTQKFSSSTYWYFPNHQNHIIYYSGFISPLPRVSLPTHAHGPLLTMTELPSLTFDLRTNSSCSHFIETTKGK